jgi:hypothetical protein
LTSRRHPKFPAFDENSRIIANVRERSCEDQGPRIKERIKEDSCTKPKAVSHDTSPTEVEKRKRNSYPEHYEAFWKAYPTDDGMSKKEGWKEWEKLSPDDRRSACEGIPGFKVWTRKQGSDYRMLHACRHLRQRRFDGFTAHGNTGNGHGVVEDETVWTKRLTGTRQMKKWCFRDWGPPPNSTGSRVPEHLIAGTDGQGWVDVEVRPVA